MSLDMKLLIVATVSSFDTAHEYYWGESKPMYDGRVPFVPSFAKKKGEY